MSVRVGFFESSTSSGDEEGGRRNLQEQKSVSSIGLLEASGIMAFVFILFIVAYNVYLAVHLF